MSLFFVLWTAVNWSSQLYSLQSLSAENNSSIYQNKNIQILMASQDQDIVRTEAKELSGCDAESRDSPSHQILNISPAEGRGQV